MLGVKSECVIKPGLAAVRRSKARRCLFGPVDHDEVRKTLRQEMERIDEQNNARWNFDFSTGTPLKGKLQWQKVDTSEDVPQAYDMPNLSIKVLSACTKYLNLENLSPQQRTAQVNNRTSRKRKQSEITGKISITFILSLWLDPWQHGHIGSNHKTENGLVV